MYYTLFKRQRQTRTLDIKGERSSAATPAGFTGWKQGAQAVSLNPVPTSVHRGGVLGRKIVRGLGRVKVEYKTR